jgi:hypothetical protein
MKQKADSGRQTAEADGRRQMAARLPTAVMDFLPSAFCHLLSTIRT